MVSLTKRVFTAVAAGSIFAIGVVMPAGAVSTETSGSDSKGSQAPSSTQDICTGDPQGDYLHRSSTSPFPASGHGWWTATSCKTGVQAVVTVQLQTYQSGKWINVGYPGQKTVYAGGGSSNRAEANRHCSSGATSLWRSVIDVDLIGYIDTWDKLTTPQKSINCTA